MAKNRRIACCILACFLGILVFMNAVYSAAGDDKEAYTDEFVREDIYIGSGQVVGELMVAGGNAVVAGKVTEDIVIVDGSLTVEPGATVRGKVFIIGGDVTIQPGANVKHRPLVIAPQGHPLVPVVIGAVLLIGAASLVALPILFWIAGRLFKKTPLYPILQELLTAVLRRWPALYVIVSLAVSAVMLTVFTTLAWETLFRRSVELFDNAFIWLVRYFASPSLDTSMIFISQVGSGVSYSVLVGAAFLILGRYRRWLELGSLTICIAGGAVLNFLLKHLFQRARPELFRVVQETGYSFPSGHAMASMCFYGMVAFLIMRIIPSWRGRLTVMTLAVLLIVAIGISRIYLGVHYPSDVVAGYAAGSTWLALCVSLLMWQERQRREKLRR
ncbi:phosphatase PAP2 family protein [Sporomusa aerivorans]|uniref:phosphatase PAP2 family protein n=1 Tax=Sporomusa aerivorans TaxID=204936 RepID=UPI00352B6C34